MLRRRAIKGLLDNFLGTYTSRYSDYDGYWLFGFIVRAERMEFDLLTGGCRAPGNAIAIAEHRAVAAFREQAKKAGFDLSSFRQAHVTITTLPGEVEGPVNSRPSTGHQVRVVASVVSDHGRTYEAAKTIFVAPHNSRAEWRSSRVTRPSGHAAGWLTRIRNRLRM